jgi:hypothetical protein
MNEVATTRKLPKIEDLYNNAEVALGQNQLNLILNHEPKNDWVKEHPTIRGYKYIPIEVTEYLLTALFTRWWVEIKDTKLVANSVVVTVRLWVIDPLTQQPMFNDGLGAAPIQTDKGAGAIDFNQMKASAIQMGAPAAESYAIKDASEKFGKIFGKDLNRKNGMGYSEMLNSKISYYTDNAVATDGQKRYIEQLISSSSLPEEQKQRIEREYLDYMAFEAEITIDYLKDNQLHPIFDNARPSAKDIINTVKEQTK